MTQTIRVWDPLIRLFHWSLVLNFTIAYLSAEELDALHIITGYIVLGLVVFRIIWGLAGSQYARFSDFLKGPAEVAAYVRSLIRGEPGHYTGHNPAGGWMIVLMLMTLLLVSYTGLKVYAVEDGRGPLAGNTPHIELLKAAHADSGEYEKYSARENKPADDEDRGAEEFWEELHEAAANFMLLLIFVHIAGVVVSSRLHKENLVRAMITGKKEQ